MRILFIGPPGCGKGTQATRLAEGLGIPFVSMGDIIREEISKGTEAGVEAREYVKKGQLVPDDIVIKILEANLPDSFVLDGFPRNLQQAVLFERIDLDCVFYITLDFEDAIERITKRRICPKCKEVYSLLTNSPRRAGICDKCGAKLITREDDTEVTARKRMAVYKEKTHPLIRYFKEKGILIKIDGRGSIDEVYERVRQALTKRDGERSHTDIPG